MFTLGAKTSLCNKNHLVNYDNDNENDDLGYQSEEYFDEAQEEDENNHSNGNVVKRGITRLYKFRREYGKPVGIKLSVTFDALNRISGKHRAFFLSFLGDMAREHIGLKILSWKKNAGNESSWSTSKAFQREIETNIHNQNTLSKLNEVSTKYSAILKAEEWVSFVKYTATKEYKVKSAATKMARSKSVYQHIMGREEEPPRGTLLLKETVNIDREYPDDEIRSVGDKLKETEDKIKEETLKVDHGTDAMKIVLALNKPSSINFKHEQHADEEGGTTVVGCENDMSIQKSNGLATLEKEMETRETVKPVGYKKMTRSIRKDSSRQDFQSQENVSPLLVLPQKSTIIALGTVYKTDGKQILHNKELLKDCYKVSIDTSLVDAGCIPDVGNNDFKIVKDAVGGFFAWPKDQVVFDPKATPPSTIQMNVENKIAPKLHTKRKNVYVSSDAMQRQAKKKSLQKSLNYREFYY
nr:hypothetical protein [Tanacetum cinerariifolium]